MCDQTEDRPDSGEFPEQPARRRTRRTWVLVGCGVACCALSVVALLGTGGTQGLISRLPGAAGAADFLGLSGGGHGGDTAARSGSSGPSASSSPEGGASPEASPGGTATPGSDADADRGPDSGSRSDSGSGAPPGDRNPSGPAASPGNGGNGGTPQQPPPQLPPSVPETGRPPADPPNDGVPDTPSDPALRPGDSGSAVTAMQQLLYGIGLYHGWRFGTYDADTTAAVQKFQEWSAVAAECREDPRGVYGPATRRALERVASA